jgi:hypothetical protein
MQENPTERPRQLGKKEMNVGSSWLEICGTDWAKVALAMSLNLEH